MKKCGKCQNIKDYTEFNKRTKSSDGLANMCRVCNSAYLKEYGKKNRTTLTLTVKKWREDNKEHYSEWTKNYLDETKNIRKEQKQVYYNNNKLKFQELCSKYYQENKELFREYARKQRKLKYKIDPIYTTKCMVRRRLGMFLKSNPKNSKTIEMIGCSWNDLVKHIELQFSESMSWENWTTDGWHLDHIIPLSSAKTEEEIIKLSHYTNLQPLWAQENYKKSNKI
jgi:hypothetical protein